MDPTQLPPAQPASNYTRPDDASQYIRTYAKDVAQLTNTPVPASAPQQKVEGALQPLTRAGGTDTPTTIQEGGVTMTDFDSSPVNRSGDASSPKEFKQEVVELTEEDSSGIFSGSTPESTTVESQPSPAPLMPQSAIGIEPTVARPWPMSPTSRVPDPEPVARTPDPEPIPTVAEPAPFVDSERDAVLARLRAKVDASRSSDTSTPPEPAPELFIRTAAPNFATTPAPVIPSPRSTFALPYLNDAHVRVSETPAGPSPLHTYSGDFADRIDEQQSSRFAVLAAQSDAGQTVERVAPQRTRTRVPLYVGSALLIVGIGAVIGAYYFLHTRPGVPLIASVPSLITYDETIPLQGSGTELQQALSDASQGASVQGNVVVTYVTGQEASSTNSIPQPGGVLITRMSLPAPDILLRNIDESSTVGYLNAGSDSRPFFILRVNSYERTFAGMLAWERTLPTDLSLLYPAYTSQQAPSTSTTLLVLPDSGPTFVDAVVDNHDVRVLRDASGRSLMLYGYVTKDTLIIARNEAAFTALSSRLNNVDK